MYLSILICIEVSILTKNTKKNPIPLWKRIRFKLIFAFLDPCGLHHCLRLRILSEGYHTDHLNLPRLRGPDRQHDESVPDAFF